MAGFDSAEKGNKWFAANTFSGVAEADHPLEVGMYDVLYLDRAGSARTVASCLDRAAAAELARTEANRRRTGRMFLAGSERPCRGDIVVIVNDNDKTLQVG
jgi:hypothetical protein